MWKVPNKQEAAYEVQARLFESAMFDLVLARQGTGVTSGCSVTFLSDMQVSIAAGEVQFDSTTPVDVGPVELTLSVGHATLGRIDIVQVSSSGVRSVVAGTPAGEPLEPPLSGTAVKLAAIYIPPATTTLTTDMISDRRVEVTSPLSVYDYFVATGEYTGSPGGFAAFLKGEQGDPGPVGVARGFAIIDSTEGYADVPPENETGDLVFRRFA